MPYRVECQNCGYIWASESHKEYVTCPSCQRKTKRERLKETLVVRAKWTMDGAESMEEMAKKHEQKAKQIRDLKKEGWELESRVEDDYAHLVRGIEED